MLTKQLTPMELGRLATFVNLLKRAREKSVFKKPIYFKDQVAVDFDSYCAKQALANKLETFLPLVIWERWPGYDMFYRGHTLQGKLVYNRSNGLYYRHYGKFKADLGVVVAPTDIPYMFELIGWLWRDEFKQLAEWMEYIELNVGVATEILHPPILLKAVVPK